MFRILEERGTIRQGPSKADEHKYPGRLTMDRVYAFPCLSWPMALRGWTERETKYDWPNYLLKHFSMSKGCFLVPVGHKLSYSSDIEWRISPSLAERILMFSLNETHIKCYVLLKHVVKYFIKPCISESLTSFHCKTAVLTLAERTPWEMWRPDRLLECMDLCLGQIILWCGMGWCPQYFLPEENLFAGRMNTNKLNALKEILLSVYNSKWVILKGNDDWGLGQMLQAANTGSPYVLSNNKEQLFHRSTLKIESTSNESLFHSILQVAEEDIEIFVRRQWPLELSINALQILIDADDQNEDSCFKNLLGVWQTMSSYKEKQQELIIQDVMTDIIPIICLYTGSVISSLPGRRGNAFWWDNVYAEWILPCFKQYRVLGSLKLATILLSRGAEFNKILNITGRLLTEIENVREQKTYSALLNQLIVCEKVMTDSGNQDDFKITECMLDHIEREYLESVMPSCPCRHKFSYQKHTHLLCTRENIYWTSCIFFMRGEMNIVPYPLKFEFYRSFSSDKENRNPYTDDWMDLVAIDAVTYFYFLQYECYRYQNKTTQRKAALSKFLTCLTDEEHLYHRETACNLLGYCMLVEGHIDFAFKSFKKSLQMQPHNNCATWHIALMVNKLLHMSNDGNSETSGSNYIYVVEP